MSSKTRARNRAFDAHVGKTAEMLAHPNVVKELGERAVSLQAMNNRAFLPKFDGNCVSLTPRQKRGDGVVVLPMTPEERGKEFHISEAGLWPTKSRLRAFKDDDPQAMVKLRGMIGDKIAFGRANRMIFPEHYAALTGVEAHIFRNMVVTSRPMAFVRAESADDPVWRAGATMLHEYTHFEQHERLRRVPENDRIMHASHEMESCYVGFTSMRAYGISSEEIKTDEYTTYMIEQLRRAKTTTDAPFMATHELAFLIRTAHVV